MLDACSLFIGFKLYFKNIPDCPNKGITIIRSFDVASKYLKPVQGCGRNSLSTRVLKMFVK